jgi:hypothetical protein
MFFWCFAREPQLVKWSTEKQMNQWLFVWVTNILLTQKKWDYSETDFFSIFFFQILASLYEQVEHVHNHHRLCMCLCFFDIIFISLINTWHKIQCKHHSMYEKDTFWKKMTCYSCTGNFQYKSPYTSNTLNMVKSFDMVDNRKSLPHTS